MKENCHPDDKNINLIRKIVNVWWWVRKNQLNTMIIGRITVISNVNIWLPELKKNFVKIY